MPGPPVLAISPPLLNTANPWATSLSDLTKLYECPDTGAVTTRTSLLAGFPHNPDIHQFAFFEAATHDPAVTSSPKSASLNTLGYSPIILDQYLGFIKEIATSSSEKRIKGFLVSVTGKPEDIAECYKRIAATQVALPDTVWLAMEVNLSCPNIPNAPPPAYNGPSLLLYLNAIHSAINTVADTSSGLAIPVGLKTPPYTHAGQFDVLIGTLRTIASLNASGVCPISFLTATNTLGSCLVMTNPADPSAALPGAGIGGMAGAPLHPLALGNVATLRKLLDAEPAALGHIRIIGAGGVSDAAGYARMKSAGAYAVGVGTGLGIHGLDVFGKIRGSG